MQMAVNAGNVVSHAITELSALTDWTGFNIPLNTL